jgi:hypothetical protein
MNGHGDPSPGIDMVLNENIKQISKDVRTQK